MSKEDIVEGLKEAVKRGESLNKAMISFYNSGYSKEDIEAAALMMSSPKTPIMSPIAQPSSKSNLAIPFLNRFTKKFQSQSSSELTKEKELETQSALKSITPEQEYVPEEYRSQEYSSGEETQKRYPSLQQPQTVQKVSQYGAKPSPVGAVVIFILVFFLLFLIGILISLFLFKENFVTFINSFVN